MPSTVISKTHYNGEKSILRINFLSGAIYEYFKVPEILYHKMNAATSKGRFLNKYIKEKFTFKRVR